MFRIQITKVNSDAQEDVNLLSLIDIGALSRDDAGTNYAARIYEPRKNVHEITAEDIIESETYTVQVLGHRDEEGYYKLIEKVLAEIRL